jgi:ribulose-5-phosphate 4-epimerase/fuculose-1-phosphate aldolase
LADTVSNAFEEEVRAVIIRNHGVVSIGNNIHQARVVIESLEEWAKIFTISNFWWAKVRIMSERYDQRIKHRRRYNSIE